MADPVEKSMDAPADAVIPPPPGTPDPITPQMPPAAAQERVLFENSVNEGAARFAEIAHSEYIEATLAGEAIYITRKSNLEPEDHEGIADATAAAYAADKGLVPYEDWSKDDLSNECRNRGLTVSGTKDELIERLIQSDAADVEAVHANDEE